MLVLRYPRGRYRSTGTALQALPQDRKPRQRQKAANRDPNLRVSSLDGIQTGNEMAYLVWEYPNEKNIKWTCKFSHEKSTLISVDITYPTDYKPMASAFFEVRSKMPAAIDNLVSFRSDIGAALVLERWAPIILDVIGNDAYSYDAQLHFANGDTKCKLITPRSVIDAIDVDLSENINWIMGGRHIFDLGAIYLQNGIQYPLFFRGRRYPDALFVDEDAATKICNSLPPGAAIFTRPEDHERIF